MVHHKVQAAINRKSEHALRALLMRLWLISSGKTKKRIQRMIMGSDGMKSHRAKHRRKKRSGHPQRRKGKRKHKLSKAAARARFKKLLPKINAGRRRKGLKLIHFK